MVAALGCFAVAVVGILPTYYTNLPLVGLLATALAITAFKENFRRWGNWFVGKRGELAITEALKSLPNDYVLPDRSPKEIAPKIPNWVVAGEISQ